MYRNIFTQDFWGLLSRNATPGRVKRSFHGTNPNIFSNKMLLSIWYNWFRCTASGWGATKKLLKKFPRLCGRGFKWLYTSALRIWAVQLRCFIRAIARRTQCCLPSMGARLIRRDEVNSRKRGRKSGFHLNRSGSAGLCAIATISHRSRGSYEAHKPLQGDINSNFASRSNEMISVCDRKYGIRLLTSQSTTFRFC